MRTGGGGKAGLGAALLIVREAAGAAHGGPDKGLDVGLQLAEVAAVVVNPFVQHLVDAERPDLRGLAPLLEVDVAQAPHQALTGLAALPPLPPHPPQPP